MGAILPMLIFVQTVTGVLTIVLMLALMKKHKIKLTKITM